MPLKDSARIEGARVSGSREMGRVSLVKDISSKGNDVGSTRNVRGVSLCGRHVSCFLDAEPRD